jgi:hypothetical protein
MESLLLYFHDHLDFHRDIHRQLLHYLPPSARMLPLIAIEGD